ncbi:ANTAR domain-containing protein [Actinoplanes sp. NPDC026619]|uniref:ANTAR domain-containing protein n=1 Tax=Actinoplanes sp. NPDC026619 TaxID=3155798 RepID=UPI0033C1B9E5
MRPPQPTSGSSRRRQQPETAAAAVLRLGEELAGLRWAKRSRSVIEQAKGVLMARLNCSAEQAFEQLVRMSQRTNTKVAEVAAGLLGLTAPVHPEPAPDDAFPRPSALPDQEAARYHLACAAMSSASDADSVAEALLAEGLRPCGAVAVVIAVRDEDGAVRLVGSHGLPRGLVSSWQRLPPELKVGFLTSVTEGRALWLTRADAAAAGLELLGDAGFRACLPLRRDGKVFGVVVVLFDDDPGLDQTGRALVAALAAAAGRRLDRPQSDRRTSIAAASAHWLEAVLEALPGSFALLCPVTDESGVTVDWRFDKCSPGARDAVGRTGDQLVGRRLLELHPQLAGSAILRGYDDVLRTGQPFTYGPAREPLGRSAATTIWIRAARLGEGILITWRHDDHRHELLERIRSVHDVGPAGWAEWDLQTGEVHWAPENAEVIGEGTALPLAELDRCAKPEDRGILAAAIEMLLRDHTGTHLTVRVSAGDRSNPVRMVLEPVLDGRERLIAVTGAFAVIASGLNRPVPASSPSSADARPPAGIDAPDPPSDDHALAETLRHLAGEVRHAGSEQQAQALVDQATGMLSVRLDCSIDTALDHLTRTARRRRSTLVQTAAEVIGVPPPPATIAGRQAAVEQFRPERYLGNLCPIRADAPDGPAVTSRATGDRLSRLRAAMAQVTDGDELASVLWREGLREVGVHAVLFGVLEPDGAVRLVGTYGLSPELVSRWRRTPSSLNVAYLRAVATDSPLWITGQEAATRGYQLLGAGDLRACLPLREDGRIFGVASVLWPRPTVPDDATRAHVAALAEAAGLRLSEMLRAGDARTAPASPAARWATIVVGALPACYALLRPVRGEAGEIADWQFEACSPETVDVAGRVPAEIIGRRLRKLYPHVLSAGIAKVYLAAMRTGGFAEWGPIEVDIETARGPVTVAMSGRASKFGDGILIHWRQPGRDALADRLRLLELAVGGGWAEWDLTGGEATWSPMAYEVLRRDPRLGPVKLGALRRYVVAEDETLIADAVRILTRLKQPVDYAVRLRRHGEISRVRFAARPVTDDHGRVTVVHAAFRRLGG